MPVYATFNEDVGAIPEIGGVNQPSELITGNEGLALASDAFGLHGPVAQMILTGPEDPFVGIRFLFAPVSSGLLRLEVSMSLKQDEHADAFLISGSGGFDIETSSEGEILASGTLIGTYQNEIPFRLRLDIDPVGENFSAVIDSEMDGFENNAPTGPLPLPFPSVALNQITIGLDCMGCIIPFGLPGGGSAVTARVAYDDIAISGIGATVVPLAVVKDEVNLCRGGPVRAAVLGRSFFGVEALDPATAVLAGTPIQTTGQDGRPKVQFRDLDKDGERDAIGHFDGPLADLAPDSTFAVLTARINDGELVEALDAVTVRQLMCVHSAAEVLLGHE